MNCLPESTLRAYRDGELDRVEHSNVENHAANCPQCRERLQEIATVAGRVEERLLSLDASAPEAPDPRLALARFKTQHGAGEKRMPFLTRLFARRWRPAWVTGVAAVVILCSLAFPAGRSLAQRFLATLRVEKVQPVRLDLSTLDGNRPLQEMLGKMISDKIVVTADEKPQHPATVTEASQLAGFAVRLLGERADVPQFVVEGQHAFHMTIDRARLQDIFDQSGRPDLLLPATLDGAAVSVQVPRSVRVQYGDCPSRNREEEQRAQRNAVQPSNCTVLVEAPSPLVNVPSDLNLQQLAEIGLQLAGMSATQAREFCQTIDWKSTLVLPIPRFVSSYSVVEVNGAQGTLINESGRRGLSYVLIWVKDGIIYCLAGHGDSSAAVALASSLD
ncbi:MAG TPA: zf-HC2 domain-containing protein [Candidatus Acidoferrum sp.]